MVSILYLFSSVLFIWVPHFSSMAALLTLLMLILDLLLDRYFGGYYSEHPKSAAATLISVSILGTLSAARLAAAALNISPFIVLLFLLVGLLVTVLFQAALQAHLVKRQGHPNPGKQAWILSTLPVIIVFGTILGRSLGSSLPEKGVFLLLSGLIYFLAQLVVFGVSGTIFKEKYKKELQDGNS